MSTWQDRVIAERTELTTKLKSLVDALGGDLALTMDETAAGLLCQQANVMLEYQTILTQRLRYDQEREKKALV